MSSISVLCLTLRAQPDPTAVFASLLQCGWSLGFGHRIMYSIEIHDWLFAPIRNGQEVLDALRDVAAASRPVGLQMSLAGGTPCVWIAVAPREKTISVDFGADCPRHRALDRVVDPSWAITVVSPILSLYEQLIERIQFESQLG